MKKVVLTLIFSIVVISIYAQTEESPKRLKYVTQAPDGSVTMTIYDDSREDTMKLESVNAFYRYQILDQETSEPIYTASNHGKECTINKGKIGAGTYDIRLYTRSFVITSKIKVSASRKIIHAINQNAVVIND